jgi:hypothetical protein
MWFHEQSVSLSSGRKYWGPRKLHNQKLHNSYSLPDVIRMIKARRMMWAGRAAHMEDERAKNWLEYVKERLLGRRGCRWEGNITVDLKEMGWEDVDCPFRLRIVSSGSRRSSRCSQ